MSVESAPLRLFALVRESHQNDAWVHINPMYASTLDLAIRSRMQFEPGDMAEIVRRYKAHHWLGETNETWYTLAIQRGHPSAVVSIEAWLNRGPFLVDGERVHIGKEFLWGDGYYRCTSIETDLVRAKYNRGDKPATVITIPRVGFEEKIAADKAKAKAERDAAKEATRADPIDLLTVAEHIRHEVPRTKARDRYGCGAVRAPSAGPFADFGSDYKRAWKECGGYDRQQWARAIGVIPSSSDADASKVSWPKVEQALFRFVREVRGFPLRDAS